MSQFDPSKEDVETVLKHLDKADKAERSRVLAAETGGKKRKTVLEKYGIDPSARYDATGRQLYPWEVAGEELADAGQEPEESDEARELREAAVKAEAEVAEAEAEVRAQVAESAPVRPTPPSAPRPSAPGGAPSA